MKNIWKLIRQTFAEWSEDKAPRLAAAVAYYTAFSLAPILVIALAVTGLVYDRATAQEKIVQQIGGLAGPAGQDLILNMLEASQDIGSNVLASIIGFIALIFGAAGVFGQLQDALNTMWEVAPKPNRGIWGMIKARFLSFTMVVGVGFLLLVSLVVSAVLTALQDWSVGLFPGFEFLMQVVNFVVSLLIITILFALIFKYVPDAEIRWKDVWLGAGVTAVLFALGKTLIGLYLGNSDAAGKFGAAGSLVVLLLWVYYTAQISFLGAEFTQVYANMFGSKVVPDPDAIPLTEAARAQQGIPRKEEKPTADKPASSLARQSQMPLSSAIYFPSSRKQAREESRIRRSVATFTSLILALGITVGYLLGNAKPRKSPNRKQTPQS